MAWFEYLIIILVVSFVFLVIFFHFYNKKHGKIKEGKCTGNCQKCSLGCSCIKWNEIIKEYRKQENKS